MPPRRRTALRLAPLLLAACSGHGPGAPPADRPTAAPPTARAVTVDPAGPTLALGVSHTCALAGGRVYCWGYGGRGELGDGAQADHRSPTAIPDLDDVVALTAGIWHTCALRKDGEVRCWGDGTLGQIGDGALGTRPRPSPVVDLRAAAIAAAGTHTCAIDQDRKVWCWGSNYRGESGPGEGPHPRPQRVAGLPPADAITAGDDYGCVLAGGEVWCWGDDPVREGAETGPARVPDITRATAVAAGDAHLCAIVRGGRILCHGTGTKGQLGDGRPPEMIPTTSPYGIARARPRRAEVAGVRDAQALVVGGDFACALLRDGTATCWGEDRDGQLGDGEPLVADGRDTPAPIPGLGDLAELAAGNAHACARTRGGAVSCWGYDEFGQASAAPAPAAPTADTLALAAARVTVGEAHACAWSDDGAWCWGDNTYGQLGDGTRTRRDAPVRPPGLGRPRELVAGARHTCSLEHGGTVLCWGDDTFGQLAGVGRPHGEPIDEHRGPYPLPPIDTRSRPTPGPVAGITDAIDIATFVHHTCVVRRGGAIVCWHAWDDAPLTPPHALPGAVEVAIGAAHTCARLESGGVRCWGTNHTGRLGDGTTIRRDGDITVRGLDDAVALAAGRLHTCALRRTGAVVCWGDGFMGQIGDRARADRPSPTAVAGLRDATALAVGEDSTCAIAQGQKVLCWGHNDAGQLGDGTHGERVGPVTARIDGAAAIALGKEAGCAVTGGGGVTCWGDGLTPPAPRRWDVAPTPRPIALP